MALISLTACRNTGGNFGLGALGGTGAGSNNYHPKNQEDQGDSDQKTGKLIRRNETSALIKLGGIHCFNEEWMRGITIRSWSSKWEKTHTPLMFSYHSSCNISLPVRVSYKFHFTV